MKKLIILLLPFLFLTTGCGTVDAPTTSSVNSSVQVVPNAVGNNGVEEISPETEEKGFSLRDFFEFIVEILVK